MSRRTAALAAFAAAWTFLPLAPTHAAPAAPAANTDPDPALLILMDVSSSMSEADASGGTRIDGAKTAVTDFIATLPTTARVGLTTYPDDGGCGAGRSIIPVSTASLGDMDREVRTLAPNGDTPTGSALEKAALDLQASGAQNGVVILVSDGESNCEGDSAPPCDVAKDLAAKGIDITVNTVGFQISDEGKTELNCIADATGGAYVDVDDGSALSDEITAYSVPQLALAIDDPNRSVDLQPGADNTVIIRGTVSNVGQIEAPNVQATLTYDSAFAPGSARPRIRIGNLAPGASTEVSWSFRPTDEFTDQKVAFTARAFTEGFETPEQTGSITFGRTTDTAALPAWLRDAQHIVVMGDSYSSGEGTGTADAAQGKAFDEPTDEPRNACHRSNRFNYGGQLATLLDTKPKVTTIACSGARTLDFWVDADDMDHERFHTQNGRPGGDPLPSQLQQLQETGEDDPADLVILTVGGNDAGFKDLATRCLFPLPCATTKVPVIWPQTAAEELRRSLTSLPAKLDATYVLTSNSAARGAGREVPILVPAYPLPFPLDTSRPCARAGHHISPANRAFLNQVALQVNATVKAEVERIRTSDGIPIWFVERTAGAFQQGHTYCDDDPWINRLSAANLASMGLDSFVGSSSTGLLAKLLPWYHQLLVETIDDRTTMLSWMNMLHPKREGYAAMAQQILTWATRHDDLAVGAPAAGDDAGPVANRQVAKEPTATVDLAATGATALAPGGTYRVTASGFAPGTPVTVALESSPEQLTTVRADEKGRVGTSVWIRSDAMLGDHHLVTSGIDPEGEPRLLRRPVTIERSTPLWWQAGAAATAAIALASIACGTVWWRRRRRERRPNRGRSRRPSPQPAG